MHILLIHQAFATTEEAGGTRHFELARCLVERGHRVTIIASSVNYLSGKPHSAGPIGKAKIHWVEREQAGERLTILRAYIYPALHRSFFHRVLSFISFMVSSLIIGLQVRSVDLVWGTSPPIFQAWTAWLLARLKRVPFLFEVRDLWPAFAVQVGVLHQPILIWASTRLERFLYRHADRVMVNSPGFIDHVTTQGARRVELIPNGADPAMFDPAANGAEFRERYSLGSNFIALYAGAHGLSNDLGVVLEAAQLLRSRSDIRFVFVGDGKDKPALMAQAQALELSNVVFSPPLPKNEISQALAAADACIAILKPIPLYATTYPNKVFDYMAAGRPVILAIDGVIRQVVESGHAGIAVCPGDSRALAQAVENLADSPDRGKEMGRSGRRLVEERFSRAESALKLALLMEEMQRQNG